MTNWLLETERLRLRPVDADDAPNLLQLNSDPEVMKYLGDEASTLEAMLEILPKIIARNKIHDDRLGLFMAHLKSTDEFIGWFLLRPDPLEQTANLEIGYRLKKVHWGKGFATEGSRSLMDYALKTFAPKRIFATAMEKNSASVAVMQKIGLKFEKLFVEPGYEHTGEKDVLYSMTY